MNYMAKNGEEMGREIILREGTEDSHNKPNTG
jgi:hypothetical protein